MKTKNSPQKEHARLDLTVPDASSSAELDNMTSILNNITSFKTFQKTVEQKLFDLEQAITFQQANSNNTSYFETCEKVVNQI